MPRQVNSLSSSSINIDCPCTLSKAALESIVQRNIRAQTLLSSMEHCRMSFTRRVTAFIVEWCGS